VSPSLDLLTSVVIPTRGPPSLIDLLSATAVLGLAGLLCWLIAGSDDYNSGGGLMQRQPQPELVPFRVRPAQTRLPL